MNLLETIQMQSGSVSGITWGSHRFSEPGHLAAPVRRTFSPTSAFRRLKVPGLYAIMVSDSNWGPRPYRAIYFGQSDDIYGRASQEHENFLKWWATARGQTLFVSFMPLYGSTELEREIIETSLIEEYKPSCNEKRSVAPYRGVGYALARLGRR